jgi:hypothetical protein
VTEVPDDQARDRLHALLSDAGSRFRALGPEPVAVACATDKFNDAWRDDFWCAVRIGPHVWEQSQFFAAGFAAEKASVPMDGGGQGTAMLQAPAFDAARAILDQLERGAWRTLVENALGEKRPGNIFAFVYQFDQLWLNISDPMGNFPGELHAVLDSKLIFVAAVEERMDELIGQPNLLRIDEIKPESLTFLSDAARRQFKPSLRMPRAAGELRKLLVEAADAIRRETSEVVIVTLAPADFGERRHARQYVTHLGPAFQVKDVGYEPLRYRELHTRPMNEDVRRQSLARYEIADFEKLDAVLRPLEKANPRGLFEAAFGVDTFDSEKLLFVIVRDELYLLHDTKLFAVQPEGEPWHQRFGPAEAAPIQFIGYARGGIGLRSPLSFDGFAADDPEYVHAV